MKILVLKKASIACLIALACSTSAALPHSDSPQHHPSAAGPSSPIRIGTMMTLTGHGVNASKEVINGFSLYWDSIGKTVSGRKIEILVEDDQDSPEIALVKMHKLVHQEHVDIFAGLRYTPIAYYLAPRIDTEYKLPFVVLISSGDALTAGKHPRWLVRTEFSTGQLIMPLGDYAYKHLGLKRIATVACRNVWAFEGVGNFQRSFESLGGEVVQKIWVPRDSTDVTAQLSTLRKDVDAVFQMTDETTSLVVAHALKKLDLKVPILSQGGVTDTMPADPAGLPNYITVLPYSDDLDTPANKAFVAQYRKRYGRKPNYWSELGYTTGMILRMAIEAKNGDVSNKEQLLDAIHQVKVDAPSGHKSFDKYGQIVQNIYVRRMNIVNGKLQNNVIYTYPQVSQFWTFAPETLLKAAPLTQDNPPCTHCQ